MAKAANRHESAAIEGRVKPRQVVDKSETPRQPVGPVNTPPRPGPASDHQDDALADDLLVAGQHLADYADIVEPALSHRENGGVACRGLRPTARATHAAELART
jgi:hypothetical protein